MKACLPIVLALMGLAYETASAQTTAPATQDAAATTPAPDLCKGAIDPYDAGDERTRFFAAAGADSELDEKEFAANRGQANAFVREFDNWNALLAFDKNANKTIDWFEAEQYRLALRDKVLAAFDADKDKQLSGEERIRAHAALCEGRIALDGARRFAAGWWSGGQDAMKRYDADGDGQLSDTERQTMRDDWRKRGEEMRQQWALNRWDANKDGQLDDSEKAAMEKEQAEWRDRAEQARREWIKPYDKDGDGQLSDEERQAMREAMRAQAEKFRQDWIKRWDTDGDGQLSQAEREAMQTKLREEWDKRRKEMDADGDGQISPEEMRGYWEKLRAKYDADGDGQLNEEERRKMMEEEGRGMMGGMIQVQSRDGRASVTVSGASAGGAAVVTSDDGSATIIIAPNVTTRPAE